jgi:hypothetical protein
MDALLCSIFLLFPSTQIITFCKGHCHELLMQRCLISSQCTLLGYDGDDFASPLKKTKEKARNSFSQWPLSTVFRSLHLLDKQLNRRSSSSLDVRLVVICDCTAMNKKSAVSTELVSSPDTEQKLTSISSPQSSRSLIL